LTSPIKTSAAGRSPAGRSPAGTAPSETLTPIVESSGFTLVEEDDVAFSVSLCREVNRIYGSYESGELEADHSVHLGLSLTVQMLARMSSTVTKGMPAMRIEVASAQTREMMTVLFGEPLLPQRGRAARRQVEGRCTRPVGLASELTAPKAITATNNFFYGDISLGEQRRPGEITTGGSPADLTPSPVHLDAPPAPDLQPSRSARSPLKQRFGRWFASRAVMIRILLGMLGCGMAAVIIDVPIVMLLLFSNLLAPLSIAYGAIALTAWWANKRRLTRASGREVPVLSRNPLSWSAWNGKASPTCAAR